MRWLKHRNRQVRVCGALLSPPEASCMLCDDFGHMWWPKGKPMPNLMEIDAFYRRQEEADRSRA